MSLDAPLRELFHVQNTGKTFVSEKPVSHSVLEQQASIVNALNQQSEREQLNKLQILTVKSF